MEDKIDLLTKMRIEVIYTTDATMPIPLYEEIKAQLSRLDDVEGVAEVIRYQIEKSTVRGSKYENAAQEVINYIKGE